MTIALNWWKIVPIAICLISIVGPLFLIIRPGYFDLETMVTHVAVSAVCVGMAIAIVLWRLFA